MELNTANPHCFTSQTDELLIEMLGGVRIETLDRMRVTIKVTVVNRNWKQVALHLQKPLHTSPASWSSSGLHN